MFCAHVPLVGQLGRRIGSASPAAVAIFQLADGRRVSHGFDNVETVLRASGAKWGNSDKTSFSTPSMGSKPGLLPPPGQAAVLQL